MSEEIKYKCPYCGEDLTKEIDRRKINTEKGVFVTACCKDLAKFEDGVLKKFYKED